MHKNWERLQVPIKFIADRFKSEIYNTIFAKSLNVLSKS